MFIKHRTSIMLRATFILTFLIGTMGTLPVQARASVPKLQTPRIHYVKWNASGSNNGTSWVNAYKDLQFALAAAVNGDQIWVAAGTYKPTTDTDCTVSFALKNGVAIYGGFAGTETSFSQRNPAGNITILSGDIGFPDDSSDNSLHVLKAENISNTAILDGFTVKRGNFPEHAGGGMYNLNSNPILRHLIFTENSAGFGSAMYNFNSSPNLLNVTFWGNVGSYGSRGGALTNDQNSSPNLTNVTFVNNSVDHLGGALTNVSNSNPSLNNVTFVGNTSADRGGAISNWASKPTLRNVTFSNNSSDEGGAIYNDENSHMTIINSILYGDIGGEIYNGWGTVSVTYSIVQGGYPGTGNLNVNPLLGALANHGGYTQTVALDASSPAIDAGSTATCPAADQRGVARPQGAACDIGAFEAEYTWVHVGIGSANMGSYRLVAHGSRRQSFTGINNGPVKISHMVNLPIIAAERVIYKVDGVNTSFTEMMGLPDHQLDNSYWLPWYNNVGLDTQLRIANASSASATVWVYIGGQQMPGTPFNLAVGASTRKSFIGVNNGPVEVVSTQNIVAAERVVYKAAGGTEGTSFMEMMGLPADQLDNTYWLPWYNNANAGLETQLRFANASNSVATVRVYIGGQEMVGSPFTLGARAASGKSFPNINSGPVKIVSTQNIVVAERVVYKAANGVNTSFSEMMALPNRQLNTTYWLPWYNNATADLDTQLRFANVSNLTGMVHVFIGGVEVTGSPFMLMPNESTRKSFMGVNSGPVKIVSNVNIIAAERVVYKVNNVPTSFSEMMALPNAQLDTTYWLPWYNNATPDLDTQLRFGVP